MSRRPTNGIAHSDEASKSSRSVEGKIDTIDELAENDEVQTTSRVEEARHSTGSEDP